MERIFHKILVPTDFSADAERAVRVGSELSRLYLAPMTIIHIYDPVAYPLPDGYVLFTPAQLSRMWAEFETRLALAAKAAWESGAVQPETRLLQGITEAEIVRFARDSGYDLIVMGTHGRTGIGRLLLGSVAARVVQTAACPVLTVKREALREETEPRAPAAAAHSA
jgi:nucleotide-binding universal stress UspA family protein